MLYIFLFIGFLFLILIGVFFVKFLKIREIDNTIKICQNNLTELLNQKENFIKEIIDAVDDNKVVELYKPNDEFNIFEREDMLFETYWNIHKYFLEKKVNKKTKELIDKINEIEEGIEGLKDFYNMNCINYNEIYSKIPFVYVFKLFKLDCKKVFKLRKLDNYEILKN